MPGFAALLMLIFVQVEVLKLIAAPAVLSAPPRLVTFTNAVEFANPVTPNCSLGWFFDTGQLFVNVGGTVRGYGSNQQAHLMVDGVDIDSVVHQQGGASTGLCSGQETEPCETVRALPKWLGAYDECGAWLNSALVEEDNRTLHGWYHSEAMCNYSGGFTNKSMSYAKSTDGGMTWKKPGHPQNVILRSPSHNISVDCDHCTDEGDATVVRDGDWLYMHFMEWNGWNADADGSNNAGGFSAGVARSKLSDRGLPGSWKKWHDGGWAEPALGGQATAISTITGAHVYLLKEEGLLVCLGYRQIPPGQTEGPRLSWATAGEHTNWMQAAEPLWPKVLLSGTYDYPSLTGRFGSADMKVGDGQEIFEYGVYFPPSWTELDWCTILFRHPVVTYRSAMPTSDTQTNPRVAALLSLPSYTSATANDTWTTTGIEVAMDPLATGYTLTVPNVAWILTSNASEATRGAHALQDCVGNTQAQGLEGPRHFIAVGEGHSACHDFGVSGPGTWLRTIGWLWPDATSAQAAAPVLEGGVSPTVVELAQCTTATNDMIVTAGVAGACARANGATSLGWGYEFAA